MGCGYTDLDMGTTIDQMQGNPMACGNGCTIPLGFDSDRLDGNCHVLGLAHRVEDFVARPCVVQKYGGSSVADVERIRSVAERVVQTRRTGVDVVVVVSAMGNTTNELLALAGEISASPGRRELDLLISVGERVSMTLLAMAIQELGEPAQSFTGSQSGIITDTQHVAAAVIEVRPHRIRRALDEGQIAIVAGFQGVSEAGEVTTLGRGGSDTTAVVLTAALGAEYCEICSDVDGVYSADPRIVAAAERLDELSIESAMAMARAGSKVLLVDALEQASQRGVTLSAGATHKASGSGTRISPGPVSDAVVGVAADDGLWLVPAGVDISAFQGAVRAHLLDGRILVDGRNLPDPGTWNTEALPVATVSAIGRSVVADPDVTLKAYQAIQAIAPDAVWWASGATWTAIVPRKYVQVAEEALHAAVR
jgi:aspartate kinase